jgi:hypothetical protein
MITNFKKPKKMEKFKIEQHIDLQTGVKCTLDGGKVLLGPEITALNRPRKKDYQKFVIQEVSETS